MMQALAALLGAVLTAAACYAAGALLIGRLHLPLRRVEHLPLAFTLGAACLHLAVFAILALHIAYWPVLVALLLGAIAAAIRSGSWRPRGDPEKPLSRALKYFSLVLFGAFTILYLFHAWAPEASADGSSYHLGFVARYLRAHGFERITTNMYAALSQGVEMLYLPAFAIGRHSAGALVHFAFTASLALAMLAYGRRLGKPWAGAAGALLAYASPVVGMDGTTAYIDVAVAAIVFSTFYWLEIWDESRDSRVLVAVGLLAGYSYAAKYTAFVMLPFALCFVAWRARKLRPLVTVTAFAALMIAPWMLKNWIVLKNPLAPFANTIFRNPYFHILSMEQYQAYFRRYDLPDLRRLPWEVTIGGATNGVLGATFLAAPIVLLALRHRAGRRLLAAGAVVLAPYFANIGTRFLIPALPFFSLAMALALSNSAAVLAMVMLFHAAASWPDGLKRYTGIYTWRLDRILVKQALRIIPQDTYLRQVYPPYGAARLVEANVPKGERVLAMNGIAESYTSREILVGYEAAFNETLVDAINVGWNAAYQPRVLQTFKFPEIRPRRVRVVHTEAGASLEQWSVHELRFFSQGSELQRKKDWRLRAWPNPGDVQLAFDNSEATRWRSWERETPGMYLDVDFGQPASIDEVRMETSYDYLHMQAVVEAMNDGGRWVKIAENPAVTAMQPSANIRRAATYEMQARGIHYLLIHSNEDFQAGDIGDDPEGWGLEQVAEGYGVRLYKVSQ